MTQQAMKKRYGTAIPTGYNWLMERVGHQGDECLIWPFSICTPGYGTFSYNYTTHLAHRFMCQQIHGDAPGPGYHAAHECGNRRCVNPRHLNWKTQRDNQLDRHEHGTFHAKRDKITPLQAGQIRQLKGIETSVETAARYGITESNVRSIQEGKTWSANRKKAQALSDDLVREIRRIGYSKSAREISVTLGIGISCITRIRTGAAYKHVL